MITYSMLPFEALINSGFKMIFPVGEQLPHLLDIVRMDKTGDAILYFLNLGIVS